MSTKTIILKSVLKLVNREGFYHLNMKKIAAEAGVAAGTIYIHFKGKEELINELFKMVVDELHQHILAGYHTGRSIKENFFDMLGNAYDYFVEDPDRFSFIEQYTFSPILFKETREEHYSILKPVSKILRDAKKQHLVKPLPDNMLIALFYGPVISMLRLSLKKKSVLRQKAVRQKLLQACWESIIIPKYQ